MSKLNLGGGPQRTRRIQMGSGFQSLHHRQIPVALQLVVGLLVLIVVGAALLLIPGMGARQLSLIEAFFTAASAAAVTGLTIFPVSTELTFWGHLVVLLLVQTGGVGLIVSVALVFRLIGRQITLADRLAVTGALGLDRPQDITLIMVRAIGLMLAIEATGAILLFLHWSLSGILEPGKAVFYAIFHAVTAYCNAGFDLFSGQPDFPNGIPADPVSLFILGGLVVLGGLGIPVYMDLLYWRRRPLSLHTRLTFKVSVVLVLLGWAGLWISEYHQAGVLNGLTFSQQAIMSLFQSVSARTAGFPGMPALNELSFPAILLLMTLMFIGTAPASTGGGITTGTFLVLWLSVFSYARGLDKVRVGKHTLPATLLMRSLVVFAISLSLVILAGWLILLTNPFSLDQVMFEVVSAYSTTGLSLGITEGLNTFGRLVIIFTMFAGRLGAITIMISLLGRDIRQNLVDYPEETILIG